MIHIRQALIIINYGCFKFPFHKSNIVVHTSFGYSKFGGQLFWASCHLIHYEIIYSYDYSNIQIGAILSLKTETEIQYIKKNE